MTTNDIDAIRARAEAATPGPWVSNDGDVYAEDIGDLIAEGLDTDNPEQSRADAEFAAHARTDVPALLAKVDELEFAHQLQQRDLLGTIAERDEARAEVEQLRAANAELRKVVEAAQEWVEHEGESAHRALVAAVDALPWAAIEESDEAEVAG